MMEGVICVQLVIVTYLLWVGVDMILKTLSDISKRLPPLESDQRDEGEPPA